MKIQNVYFASAQLIPFVTDLGEKAPRNIKSLLVKYGYPEKAAEAVWRWYGLNEKKRVTRF